ncbi:MAG: chromosome segregation protein SMC [Sandaracinaceae bacterium]|nr:chromosome segregation protein SMC [Sandaracinaceae bacterium]
MKIKKLEICGFKSFVDKTVIHFDHDVTGIVGPNGCGKSNVVDAIRWAIGEQSTKHLRDKSMDNVIFNGSESRGPHSFAEVTITFDNTAGIGPAEYRDYAEIAVTRRLDRAGSSDYLINKTPVRLMDITELFLGTGVGTKAYSIIEQGRIGFIVSSKPEERRHLIEEAAGVTKYKVKKKAAERKMEQTRANLLRVGDITAEIERSLASLKRQAQKAERYKEYRKEIRDLELYSASHKYMELIAVEKVVSSELDVVSATVEGTRAALRVREAEVEADRMTLLDAERKVELAQNAAFASDNAVKQLEAEIARHQDRIEAIADRERAAERELADIEAQRTALFTERSGIAASLVSLEEHAALETEALSKETSEYDARRLASDEAQMLVTQERARVADAQARIARAEAVLNGFERRRDEARARLEKMHAEKETLLARVVELGEEANALRARLSGLAGGKENTEGRKLELETELQDLRARIKDSDALVDRLRNELAGKRARLRSLEEIQARFEGVGNGVKAVMTKFGGDGAGVLGLLADRLDVSADLTHALAGALGDRVQDVVVENLETAGKVLNFLAEGTKGRATLLPRTTEVSQQATRELPQDPSVVGWLADLVRAELGDESLVRNLLGDVLVVEDFEAAMRLHQTTSVTLVTRRGDVLGADGRVTGGRGEEVGAHMLDLKREVRELHTQVAKLDGELSTAVTNHSALRSGIAERQAALESARNAAHENEIALVKAERDVHAAEENATRTRARIETIGVDADELTHSLAAASDEESAAREEITSAHLALRDAEEALVGCEEMNRERRAAVDAQTLVVTEVRVRAAQAEERAQGDRNTVGRLDRSIDELSVRSERVKSEVLAGANQQGELSATILTSRETLSQRVQEAMAAQETLARTRAEFDAARALLGEFEVTIRETRSFIEKHDKRGNELMLRARELSMELSHLLEHVVERHRIDVRTVLGDFHDREIPSAQTKARIDELARLIERMGEINLTAIEEYEEQSKRFEYYATHQKDLEEALDQLDKAIRKMNIESKRLFRETFAEVNARFKRVFPMMFGGGQAELKLTGADDILESGVEIVAQPPGKRLGNLELMSGGEKALTAVSLIFAIFQYKPSPFCLLDEVDAPLDEANIGRFSDAIRQMTDDSQFIVITHSKRTMETADILYGVTMETPGISKLVAVELRKADAKRAPKPMAASSDVAVA